MKRIFWKLMLCAGLSLGIPAASQAAELTVGGRTELAMDPHFQWLDTNTAYYNHIYSALTKIDEKSQIGPYLAESWQTPNDKKWRFKLKPGVKFHNGQNLGLALQILAPQKIVLSQHG